METSTQYPFLMLGESVVDLISTEIVDSLEHAACYQRHGGGQVANLAANMAIFGFPTTLGACLGNDGFGNYLKNRLSQVGVDISLLQFTNLAPTTTVTISRQSGTPDFNIYRGADQHLAYTENLASAAAESKFIHTSAFALSRDPSRTTILTLLRSCQGSGKTISFDPNYHPRFWPDIPDFYQLLTEIYNYVTVTKPSLDDSIRIFGSGLKPTQYLEHFLDLGAQTVVLTMGSQGSILGTANGERVHIQANQVSVEDVTGAGDAFWSGLLAGLFQGFPPLTAAKLGQAVAEYKIGFMGPVKQYLPLEKYLEIAENFSTVQV